MGGGSAERATGEGVDCVVSEVGETEEGVVEEEGEEGDGESRECWRLCRPCMQ